jgi:hypothetical protein
MVLYTPLSEHDIFPQSEASYQLVSFKGRSLYAREVDNKLHLVQLLSTNPEDFLKPEFAPGTILPNEFVHPPQ